MPEVTAGAALQVGQAHPAGGWLATLAAVVVLVGAFAGVWKVFAVYLLLGFGSARYRPGQGPSRFPRFGP